MASTRPSGPPTASEPTRTPTGRVAQAEMRAANMGVLLRHLRRHGGRSRARLAEETGLSKATTSSLVTDLAQRGLVREGDTVRAGGVGRPGTTVTLDGAAVTGIGLELSVDYAAYTAVTLGGAVVRERVAPLDVARLGPDAVLDRTAAHLTTMIDSLREAGAIVVGITVAPPGIIDYATGTLRFAPNLGWRNIALLDAYAARLGPGAPPVRLENDANLAAVAEYEHYRDQGIDDLLHLTGEVGVGAGIISSGRLMRGWSGFSGEVGHLNLDPEQRPCNCGRRGCWETVVGLNAFLDLAVPADDPLHDPGRALEDRLLTLQSRAAKGDARVLDALATIVDRLASGLSILVDVLNPRVIVLGGYYSFFGETIIGPLSERLDARRLDPGSGVLLAPSHLGFMATARGGALLALEDVFETPTLVAPPASAPAAAPRD